MNPCDSGRTVEEDLLRRYQETGDLRARDEVVARYLPLARGLAARYAHGDEPLCDLVQVASLALLKAIDRFDPAVGRKFTSFAAPTILGELKRYFRDNGWPLHMPRELKERALAVRPASEALSARLGRAPGIRELARELSWPPEQVIEACEAGASYRTAPLDGPPDDKSGECLAIADRIGKEDDGFALVEDRAALAAGLQALPPLERSVLGLRFFDELTQREIGERLGYSQMHVSRVIRRALDRLRANAAEERQAA
ncbi:MAG TPA: SigB/SigF/SigG family RNA polymerase sigma factor [Thermoleophilaceae bacterium]